LKKEEKSAKGKASYAKRKEEDPDFVKDRGAKRNRETASGTAQKDHPIFD
jgi:hypothetical protein